MEESISKLYVKHFSNKVNMKEYYWFCKIDHIMTTAFNSQLSSMSDANKKEIEFLKNLQDNTFQGWVSYIFKRMPKSKNCILLFFMASCALFMKFFSLMDNLTNE